MRQITKISKNQVKISREDWDEMWRRLKLSVGLQPVTLSGGDCDDFCGAACADDGGCDLSFGGSGECGAYCNNGEVYLEAEVWCLATTPLSGSGSPRAPCRPS